MDISLQTYIMAIKHTCMASVIRKGTFGQMQKSVDAASDQGLHFLTLVTSKAHIFIAV